MKNDLSKLVDDMKNSPADVVIANYTGAELSPEREAARKFLSSPRFDKCKINLFVMRDGCRALPSDSAGV